MKIRKNGKRLVRSLGWLSLCMSLAVSGTAHGHGKASSGNGGDRVIEFPDTPGYQTLVVDLHTHSVFSDGHVWPNIRVGEALRDGLDALAITEHLEWQPHLADIPHPDRNRAFEEAEAALPEGSDLILIAGSEITRRAPAGHMNAVFITDANGLVQRGPVPEPFDAREYYAGSAQWPAADAVAAVNAQGGFVFWNHSWSDFTDARTAITDFHREQAAQGRLHGIEVANGGTYSPESFQVAIDHGLTPIGVSDVHNLIDWDYAVLAGGHRPVNLVFAEERSATGIHQALREGRTVVWFKNLLIGREEHLVGLLNASIDVASAAYRNFSSILNITLSNNSDATMVLKNTSSYTFNLGDVIEVPPHGELSFYVRMPEREQEVQLTFEVQNALSAPDAHPAIELALQPDASQ